MHQNGSEARVAQILQEVRVRKRTWRKDDLSSRVKKSAVSLAPPTRPR